MRRREFIALAGGAAACPVGALAQGKPPKVGFLNPGPVAALASRVAWLVEGLRTAGLREQDIDLLARSADSNPARLPPLAVELVEQRADVVVAVSRAAIKSVQAASATVPIVGHDLETDPVASGLIESYARPGGQITGVFFDFPEFRRKWLELLQEAIPGLSKIAMLWDPVSGAEQAEAVRANALDLRLDLKTLEVRSPGQIENAFKAARSEGVDALLVLSSPLFGNRPNLLADLALRHGLPTVTLFPDFARSGGLMAYGPDLFDTYRPLGPMLAKILRGAKPGDLPVERPSKFQLVVNLRAARSIGLTVPTSILLRADEVIE